MSFGLLEGAALMPLDTSESRHVAQTKQPKQQNDGRAAYFDTAAAAALPRAGAPATRCYYLSL